MATGQDDDTALLRRVERGDEAAITALYDRYARLVYSVSLRVLRDATAAEDVLQEIFMQLWRSPDSFPSERGSLAAWLAVVTRNRSIDTLRRKRPTDLVEDVELAMPGNLADESDRNRMLQRTRAVIASLPPDQRKTLEMAFFDGLTHMEIAEMTSDPLDTVKARIHGALLSLRKAFQA